MRELQGKIDGPFSVDEDSILRGMITVEAIVRRGVVLQVHGMITGDLTIEDGASAVVHGMVNGTVRNYGEVLIYGKIDALVDLGSNSRSRVDDQAIIGNPRRQRT
jgi:cytoskeletal protein CcmA (bactofilin family)